MQLTTIFALFCGTIITVHFIDILSERIRSKKRNKLSKTVRKSWYCFFSPERLLGEQRDSKVSEYQDNRQEKTREDRRRAQEEQRRRLVIRP
jgi:hypothetical protein